MKAFARRGFQLRAASLETRVAYTGFLLLIIPGIATLVALSMGRMGFSPTAIASYYRGGESELSFPRTFWQLMETSHFHLFTVPVVGLILCHLLYGTNARGGLRIALTAVVYLGALFDALGPWAVRYFSAGFAYLLLLGWVMLAAGMLAIVALTLFALWGPARRDLPVPMNGEDKP